MKSNSPSFAIAALFTTFATGCAVDALPESDEDDFIESDGGKADGQGHVAAELTFDGVAKRFRGSYIAPLNATGEALTVRFFDFPVQGGFVTEAVRLSLWSNDGAAIKAGTYSCEGSAPFVKASYFKRTPSKLAQASKCEITIPTIPQGSESVRIKLTASFAIDGNEAKIAADVMVPYIPYQD